ncbi:MAG: hypothetical protein ACOH2R_03370 [Pseudomonas sp.]
MAPPVNPWREPSQRLITGEYQSIIIEYGKLTKAVPGSTNNYLFSEKGAGVQPVVIVGTLLQVIEFLLDHQQRGFESQVPSLPDIYMGISPYKEKQQFTGVFPLNDALANIAGFLTSLFPAPDWATLVGAPDQLNGLKKTINGLSDKERANAKSDVLYVKFSCLPGDNMQKIGTRKISFGETLQALQRFYKKR